LLRWSDWVKHGGARLETFGEDQRLSLGSFVGAVDNEEVLVLEPPLFSGTSWFVRNLKKCN
jgi:hypothetical protein